MKEIQSISLVLENCELIHIDRRYLGKFLLDNYTQYVSRIALNSITTIETFNTVVLHLHPNLNRTIQEDLTDDITPIERLCSRDITQLILYFDDGTEGNYMVNWSDDYETMNSYQKNYLNEETGELFIVISADENIEDYFEKDELRAKTLKESKWNLYM